MTYCEYCGETLGQNRHACGKREQRFGEFNPQPIPYRKEPLFKSREEYDAEVDRRLALMRKPSEILAEEDLRQKNVQQHISNEESTSDTNEVNP